ncbi:MAG: MBL fold metallo-hydrolase [Candidatus Thorarchaeota archaeon]|jgi:L-ascorbate metabolism protein UlaG (beta-lactamase superfamily)
MSFELEIEYLGQSGFRLAVDDSVLLIDPSNKKSGDFVGNLLYCTHKHFDHTGGVATFLERNKTAMFIANEQVLREFPEYNDRSIKAVPGNSHTHGIWTLEFIEGKHGVFRGVENTGVVIRAGGKSFGHPGDTVTLKGFKDKKLDILAVPIAGGPTMSPKKALQELKTFQVILPRIIPMHWLFRNPNGFCKKVQESTENISCNVMRKGTTLII